MNTRAQAFWSGKAILEDWLGEGGVPVPREQAESRAATCVACPKNWEGDWWTLVSREVVHVVLERKRAKEAMKLETSRDVQLHFCRVCLCDLPTKVHVPMKHIAKHTSEDVWKDLPSNCWMLRERQAT